MSFVELIAVLFSVLVGTSALVWTWRAWLMFRRSGPSVHPLVLVVGVFASLQGFYRPASLSLFSVKTLFVTVCPLCCCSHSWSRTVSGSRWSGWRPEWSCTSSWRWDETSFCFLLCSSIGLVGGGVHLKLAKSGSLEAFMYFSWFIQKRKETLSKRFSCFSLRIQNTSCINYLVLSEMATG